MRYIFVGNYSIEPSSGLMRASFPVERSFDIFDDHFPGFPVFPGALILETMAQHGVILLSALHHGADNSIPVLVGADRVKFNKMVIPDCVLDLKIKKEFAAPPMFKISAKAFVEGELCASAFLTLSFQEAPEGAGLDFLSFRFPQ